MSALALAQVRTQLRQKKQEHVFAITIDSSHRKLSILNRLNRLQQFTLGRSEAQRHDKQALKNQDFFENVSKLISDKRYFALREIYTLVDSLMVSTGQRWNFYNNHEQLFVYSQFRSIFPGLVFHKSGESFRIKSFSYNIKFESLA